MNKILGMKVTKERYRAINVRKFPDSLRERLWSIKAECNKKVTLEDILIEAVEVGLPKIEMRVFRRIPNFVMEPEDD